MSGLEDRCTQFHEAATGTGKSKGPAKEIATLRKFLYKNQTQRFTDKASGRLLDTIAIYAHNPEFGEGLLDDALKMPFTVFSTKQKSKMLKWMEERKRASNPTAESAKKLQLSVIDVSDGTLSLMQGETGDTYEDVPLPVGELGTEIQKAFDNSEDAVDVEVVLEGSQVVVKKILV